MPAEDQGQRGEGLSLEDEGAQGEEGTSCPYLPVQGPWHPPASSPLDSQALQIQAWLPAALHHFHLVTSSDYPQTPAVVTSYPVASCCHQGDVTSQFVAAS